MTTRSATAVVSEVGAPAQCVVAIVALLIAATAVMAPYEGGAAIVLALAGVAFFVLPIGAVVPMLILLAPVRLFAYLPVVGAELSLTSLLLLALALSITLTRSLRAPIALTRWEWSAVLWCGWIGLSWLWSSNRRTSVAGSYQWALLFAAILVVVSYVSRDPRPARALRRAVVAVLVLIDAWCVVGFTQSAIGLDGVLAFLRSRAADALFLPSLLRYKLVALDFNWKTGYGVQPFGPFINGIEFGIFTAVGLGVAAAATASRANLAPKWLALSTAVVALAANLAALKGTGWLAAVAAILTVFVALGGSVRRLALYASAVVVCAVILANAFRDEL